MNSGFDEFNFLSLKISPTFSLRSERVGELFGSDGPKNVRTRVRSSLIRVSTIRGTNIYSDSFGTSLILNPVF